jgi:hypothetical protein
MPSAGAEPAAAAPDAGAGGCASAAFGGAAINCCRHKLEIEVRAAETPRAPIDDT